MRTPVVFRFLPLLVFLFAGAAVRAAEPPFRLDAPNAYKQIALSPDGSKILAVQSTGYVHLWDVATKTKSDFEPANSGGVESVAFCMGGKYGIVGDRQKTSVVEMASGKVVATLPAGKQAEARVGDVVITYGRTGYSAWQASTGKELISITPKGNPFWFTLKPDGKLLACIDSGTDLRLFDLTTGKERLGVPGLRNNAEVALSPDGKRLAVGEQFYVTVFDIEDGEKRPKLRWRTRMPDLSKDAVGTDNIRLVSFSPDSKTVLVHGGPGLFFIDLATQKHGPPVVADSKVHFTTDGRTMVVPGQQSGALIIANADGSTRAVINIKTNRSFDALQIAEESNRVAVLDYQGGLWGATFDAPGADAVAVKDNASLPLPDGKKFDEEKIDVASLEFSPDGKYLVVAPSRSEGIGTLGVRGWLAAWDVAGRKLLADVELNNAGAWTFLPDGLFAWGSTGFRLDPKTRREDPKTSSKRASTFINFKTGKVDTQYYRYRDEKEVAAVKNRIKDLYFTHMMRATPDGKSVFAQVTGSYDALPAEFPPGIPRTNNQSPNRTFVLIDAKTLKITAQWDARNFFGNRISLSPDGKLVARGGSGNGSCGFWDLNTRKEVTMDVKVAYSGMDFADGGKLFCTWGDNALNVHEVEAGVKIKEIKVPEGHSAHVTAVAVSPASKLFVTCGSTGDVQVRDLDTGAAKSRFNAHAGPILAAAISPDGKLLATLGSKDRVIKLWPLDGK